jgi:glycosyltransferase involved in cell wall biosynthesis
MIEAIAFGTPVIAYRAGSVPEIIDSGVNGFVVESIEEAAEAVSQVQYLDRTRCRRSFEERFSSARMAADTSEFTNACVDVTGSGGVAERTQVAELVVFYPERYVFQPGFS